MDQKKMDSKLHTHFLNIYAIALSDMSFDTTELEMLCKIGEERGVAKTELDKILINPSTATCSLPESLEEKISYLYDYTRIIWADGVINDDEKASLIKFCQRFGFLDENIEGIATFIIDAVKEEFPLEKILSIIKKSTEDENS